MEKRKHTPSSGLYQRVPVSVIVPLTGYSSASSLKITEPYSLFVDLSYNRSAYRIEDACLLFGYTPPEMFDHLRRTKLRVFAGMTEQDIENACRYTSERILNRIPVIKEKLEKWKEEKAKKIEEKFGGSEEKAALLKQQITKLNNIYSSLLENIDTIYRWVEKTYPDLIHQKRSLVSSVNG